MPWGPGTASLVLGIPARRRGSNVGITAVVLTASHLLLMTYDESILRAALITTTSIPGGVQILAESPINCLFMGLGGRGDGPPTGSHRGGPGPRRPEQGRSGLRSVGPVRAAAAAHERLVGRPRRGARAGRPVAPVTAHRDDPANAEAPAPSAVGRSRGRSVCGRPGRSRPGRAARPIAAVRPVATPPLVEPADRAQPDHSCFRRTRFGELVWTRSMRPWERQRP